MISGHEYDSVPTDDSISVLPVCRCLARPKSVIVTLGNKTGHGQCKPKQWHGNLETKDRGKKRDTLGQADERGGK